VDLESGEVPDLTLIIVNKMSYFYNYWSQVQCV